MATAVAITAFSAGPVDAAPEPTGGADQRTEVPIREVDLANGVRRYALTLKVGETSLAAGVDTGSTGLRVLRRAVTAADARKDGPSDAYSYQSGTQLLGDRALTQLGMGDLTGPIHIQLVAKADCKIQGCPASKIPQDQFGIQGDGLAGQGFPAILGLSFADAEVDKPLVALGVRRWIVELPEPGQPGTGRLILNPTDAEVAGFVMLPLIEAPMHSGLYGALIGCLLNDATKAKVCGPTLLDSGTPGISVFHGRLGAVWPTGAAATLAFYDHSGKPRAIERLTIGMKPQASRLAFADEGGGLEPSILAGFGPYFAFSVLYDAAHNAVGLKPRAAFPGGPEGLLVQ